VLPLGGPFAHANSQRICALGLFDWIFDGEADLSFPIAVERRFRGDGKLGDIVGLTWRDKAGYHNNAVLLHAKPRQRQPRGSGLLTDPAECPASPVPGAAGPGGIFASRLPQKVGESPAVAL